MVFAGKRTAKSKHFNNMQKNKEHYPQDKIYCTVNPKAGMNEDVMMEWIRKVWQPFSTTFTGATYLILDWCLCHMTSSVMEEFA